MNLSRPLDNPLPIGYNICEHYTAKSKLCQPLFRISELLTAISATFTKIFGGLYELRTL